MIGFRISEVGEARLFKVPPIALVDEALDYIG